MWKLLEPISMAASNPGWVAIVASGTSLEILLADLNINIDLSVELPLLWHSGYTVLAATISETLHNCQQVPAV